MFFCGVGIWNLSTSFRHLGTGTSVCDFSPSGNERVSSLASLPSVYTDRVVKLEEFWEEKMAVEEFQTKLEEVWEESLSHLHDVKKNKKLPIPENWLTVIEGPNGKAVLARATPADADDIAELEIQLVKKHQEPPNLPAGTSPEVKRKVWYWLMGGDDFEGATEKVGGSCSAQHSLSSDRRKIHLFVDRGRHYRSLRFGVSLQHLDTEFSSASVVVHDHIIRLRCREVHGGGRSERISSIHETDIVSVRSSSWF